MRTFGSSTRRLFTQTSVSEKVSKGFQVANGFVSFASMGFSIFAILKMDEAKEELTKKQTE